MGTFFPKEPSMSAARTVVVSGAAGGIGSEIVDRFLRNGDNVVATDVSQDALDTWRARWDSSAPRGRHSSLFTVAADISDRASVAALVEATREQAGGVEVLVNCASIFPLVPFEELTLDTWHQVLETNLTGTFLMIKTFLPLMKDRGSGRIVNIGSGTFFVGTEMQSAYAASKGGILGLTRVLARELAQYGITVNLVTPGFTITPNAADTMPESVREMQRRLRAIKRDELPEDIIGSVFFLASDEAAFVTGQTLNIDGGRHLL